MGLTCKPYDKYESMFKKLDNKIKADKEALRQKSDKTTKNKSAKSTTK